MNRNVHLRVTKPFRNKLSKKKLKKLIEKPIKKK